MFTRISIWMGIVLAGSGSASAAAWEELFSAATGDTEVRVELKKSSLRERLVRGEKIITAHLRTYYRDGRERVNASSDYEIHCAARTAYRSNLDMEVTASDRTKSTVRKPQREMLSGKDYQDFTGLMDILCSR